MTSQNVVSPDEWKQFQLFGFLVLRGRLTPEETSALCVEVEGCLRAAHGSRYDERPWMSGMAGTTPHC
jgi:hypothetical protein